MTAKQEGLYWREWGLCRKALIALGFTSTEAAEKRHELHIRAHGADKSHAAFLDGEFTKILGVFRSYSRPGSLDEQLRVIDEPEARKRNLLTDARRRALENGIEPHGIDAYLDHIARQVTGKGLDRVNQIEAAKIRGIVNRQWHRIHRSRMSVVPSVSAGNPF